MRNCKPLQFHGCILTWFKVYMGEFSCLIETNQWAWFLHSGGMSSFFLKIFWFFYFSKNCQLRWLRDCCWWRWEGRFRKHWTLQESLLVVTHLSWNNSVKCMLVVTTCCIYKSTSYIYLFNNFKEKCTFSTRLRIFRDQVSQEILIGIVIFLCLSKIYLSSFTWSKLHFKKPGRNSLH